MLQSALSVSSIPLKSSLNVIGSGQIADAARLFQLGTLLRGQIPQVLRAQAPATDANAPASTVKTIVLPYDARANTILRAYARAGTGTLGEMTVDAPNTTTTTGQHIGIQPDGNIMTLGTDAWTSIDVVYVPERADPSTITLTLPVSSNLLTLPTSFQGLALNLVYAYANTGTTVGQKRIITPASSSGTAACACFNLAKTGVYFNSGDAVTNATVIFTQVALSDLNTVLESDSVIA